MHKLHLLITFFGFLIANVALVVYLLSRKRLSANTALSMSAITTFLGILVTSSLYYSSFSYHLVMGLFIVYFLHLKYASTKNDHNEDSKTMVFGGMIVGCFSFLGCLMCA